MSTREGMVAVTIVTPQGEVSQRGESELVLQPLLLPLGFDHLSRRDKNVRGWNVRWKCVMCELVSGYFANQ